MSESPVDRAAALLWRHWREGTRLDALPADCRPVDRAAGYAVQAALAARSGRATVGWKIAATSAAGQAHIGVDAPLAGRLLDDRVLRPGAVVTLGTNAMRVAEVEFAFRMGRALPPREAPYSLEETLDAVASLHPSVEVPDSRYVDFVRVGAAQLIADDACACWLVLGEASADDWRARDLAAHPVSASIGGRVVARGSGAAALGDPRAALAWIANELRAFGPGLAAGDVVTTGTCVVPVPVAPGDAFRADYGPIGSLSLSFA
ncbi:MAG TPA: fumarylacetoacetate hydrolase family protein [Burkholderiaceae bacterium]|nr:fumarylacetoacetate hydrolase family protein [Burkholderiaceae bacterium]